MCCPVTDAHLLEVYQRVHLPGLVHCIRAADAALLLILLVFDARLKEFCQLARRKLQAVNLEPSLEASSFSDRKGANKISSRPASEEINVKGCRELDNSRCTTRLSAGRTVGPAESFCTWRWVVVLDSVLRTRY